MELHFPNQGWEIITTLASLMRNNIGQDESLMRTVYYNQSDISIILVVSSWPKLSNSTFHMSSSKFMTNVAGGRGGGGRGC